VELKVVEGSEKQCSNGGDADLMDQVRNERNARTGKMIKNKWIGGRTCERK
jgi:hypothetical protein